MKILVYTHSDYSWVWKYWHKQTDKFLSNKFKLINKNSILKFSKLKNMIDEDLKKINFNKSFGSTLGHVIAMLCILNLYPSAEHCSIQGEKNIFKIIYLIIYLFDNLTSWTCSRDKVVY